MTARQVRKALKLTAQPEKAAFFPRFFKTGKGEYGEGDRFLGVVVPDVRKVARKYRDLPASEIVALLADPMHECRLAGLLVLVDRYEKGDERQQKATVELYLDVIDGVNNWDLVDATAHKILGPWLEHRDRRLLYDFARSNHLWRQRIAVIACLHFIRASDFDDFAAICDLLLNHKHDLIHKAVGWMLREAGKRDEDWLREFLRPRYAQMPRTMLRYAIEKLDPPVRKAYLTGSI